MLKYHLNVWKIFDDDIKDFFNFIITDDCSLNKIEDVLQLSDRSTNSMKKNCVKTNEI